MGNLGCGLVEKMAWLGEWLDSVSDVFFNLNGAMILWDLESFTLQHQRSPQLCVGKRKCSQWHLRSWVKHELCCFSDQITADHFFWLDSAPSLGFPGGACAQSLLLLVRRFPGSQCAVPREPPLSAACCSLLLWAVSIKILHLPCLRVSLSPLQRYFHITSACAWWSA